MVFVLLYILYCITRVWKNLFLTLITTGSLHLITLTYTHILLEPGIIYNTFSTDVNFSPVWNALGNTFQIKTTTTPSLSLMK